MSPFHAQAQRQQGSRIASVGATENIDICHLRVLEGGRSKGKIEHCPEMVLELGGDRTLDGPVTRVMRPGRDLVDHEHAARPEELDRQDTDGTGDLGNLPADGIGALDHLGGKSAGDENLAADAIDLGRLGGGPGDDLPGGTAGHHDRQLRFEGNQFFHQNPARDGVQHRSGLDPVVHHPDALAVVAASGRLENQWPSMFFSEADDGSDALDLVCRRVRAAHVQHDVGGNRDAVLDQDGSHVCLVDGHLQRLAARSNDDAILDEGRDDGQIDLLVVERHDVNPISQRSQFRFDEGRPQQHFGCHSAGSVVGPLGQHRHREAQGARGLGGHARQLSGTDHTDVVGAQVASLGRISVPHISGTLGEEPSETMAKPLGIGSMINVDHSLPDTVDELRRLAEAGFDHAWALQIFGPDALTLLATVGAMVPGIGLGTGVVPIYPRHPMMLAQQALTVQWATDNRLILGVGLSHQLVVENVWGLSYDKPAGYMREYLASLMPLLRGEKVDMVGERVTTRAFTPLELRGAAPPPVLVAALGETMLKLAGRVTDGTVTWMTGIQTIASHISPVIRAAAEKEGRPAPRIVVALPVSVTADIEGSRERVNEEFRIYPNLPSYKAMLDKEGASSAADVALLGDEEAVAASIEKLAEVGATDFVASVVGTREERARTYSLLSELARAE